METARHKLQMNLLIETLYPWLDKREDGFMSGNMFMYYSMAQVRNRDFMGPDFFAVVGVPKGERKSWVVWEEGKGPDVVIELLSESTAVYDQTTKKQLYLEKMRVPEYFWYDPFDSENWSGFRLKGSGYEPIQMDQGGMQSDCLGLRLVRWEGSYYEANAVWLRWAYQDGTLIPTQLELAIEAQQQADLAQQQADLAQQQAEQEHLRAELAQQQAEQEHLRAELAQQQAEQEHLRAEQEHLRAEQEHLRADLAQQQVEQERIRAEQLTARLRELGIEP